ncbi:DNA cytosine methyltransferase [Dietzia cercidiphylli]|uniref:DNA cytosine methyltransferase n=1 Tax=Dietzia cercidiphylli TaxID=498199 RepID=UPI00223B119A|nr:DNA cytosine methyltransferase [Dietzia cercidiphylli]MCT1515629.1 DNA (cytosine-5-)-methyltransferase [Dietzia cercidiphylli]
MSDKSSPYGVKLIRGPYVDLAPNDHHVDELSAFLRLAASLRGKGAHLAADLFSGAGGISLGLEEAGYDVVLGADHFDAAVATHAHHFAGLSLDWDLADPDVVERVANLIKDAQIEILAGGPPCQPFSKAGRSMIRHRVQLGERDPHDERRDLWRSFLEVATFARPRAILMENVPDLALDREMFIFRSIVEELEQDGYSVHTRIVETWRYGVPQMRQRLLVVALRDGVAFEWPADATTKTTLWNAIGELPEVEGGWRPNGGAHGWAEYDGPVTEYQRRMRRKVAPSDEHKIFDHITRPVRDDDRAAFESMTHETKYSDLAPEHQRYRNDIFDDKYKRLDENDLSRTITAHIAKDGYWYIHPRQPRTLTVREAARVQSFPDYFRFSGPPSAAFKQIGNAVPPMVAATVGNAIRSALAAGESVGFTTREIGMSIADWYRNRRGGELAIPWLRTDSRWIFVSSEILLQRATKRVIQSFYPALQSLDVSAGTAPATGTLSLLANMAEGVGRSGRAEQLRELAAQMGENPEALWAPTIDRSLLPAVSASVGDLAELAVPTRNPDGQESEEPILTGRGVLRVASRFLGNDVDKRNKMTDGRLAVSRLIGIGENSREAQLGLIELAASICIIDRPACSLCPLRDHCAYANGLTEPPTSLF